MFRISKAQSVTSIKLRIFTIQPRALNEMLIEISVALDKKIYRGEIPGRNLQPSPFLPISYRALG